MYLVAPYDSPFRILPFNLHTKRDAGFLESSLSIDAFSSLIIFFSLSPITSIPTSIYFRASSSETAILPDV